MEENVHGGPPIFWDEQRRLTANRPAANAGSRWIAEGGLRSLLSADGPFMHTVLVMADVFGALVLQVPE
jgi:hypothetical protein